MIFPSDRAVPKPTRVYDADYLRDVRQRPCVVCLHLGVKQSSRTEAHHVKTRGAGGGDDTAVALCTRHHKEFHLIGRKSFLLRHEIDLLDVAAKSWSLWQRTGGI